MEGDLASFVDHAEDVLAESPEASRRTTDLRITVPLLKTLGWDVHGAEVVPDHAVPVGDGETVTVDYALCPDGDPSVFVVTVAAGAEIESEHGRRLEAAMAAAGVEYGLVAAGDDFAFVAGGPEDPERVRCSIAAVPDRRSILAHYTREAAGRRLERRRSTAREAVAEDLAERRDAVAAAVGAALSEGIEGPVGEELEAAGDAIAEGTIAALAAGNHPRSVVESDGDDGGGGDGRDPDAEGRPGGPETAPAENGEATEAGNEKATGAENGEATGTESRDGTSPGSTAPGSGGTAPDDGAETDDARAAESGDPDATGPDRDGSSEEEYVVRFFDGSNSVGAVGHGTAPGALVQAVEYLIERRAVAGAVDLPWGPTDDRAVLNHDPVHPDGTEMVDAARLSNGYYLCTTIGPDAVQEVLEDLAESAGLRVMFQGDW